ncbi:spermidine/putrescine ABC transporter permease PotC [Ketobacter sp. MCCC 1A13808]|uniref:spermidine/putrescine ABC transporter permease PotC n=1 Tax=Ketobacter sp. MCCC 1A13808 TaxID=2602738 RepID=UPI000F28E019|nr:spermidine/putrescine ABC transporter permease PotC [Ketobacter sp. MCCC 1A13808]MVF13255.1 spermidine/putrescine ABC transporter permease PotC [Ketobacter sp. MCCC 1A13808]RLP54248.1 MAG: spermidine/putrescine ABC transporter permease PotC [Ketobacter sp.]
MKTSSSRWWKQGAAGLFITGIFIFLYMPIVVLVVNSFNESKYGHEWRGFSWKWYEKLWNNSSLLEAFTNSLKIACLSATIATVLGALIALAIYRYQFPMKKIASGLVFVLMMSPDIVLAITFLIVFMALGIELGFWSLLIAHITFCLPFVVITVYSQLKGFDINLLEAAQDLGARESAIFTKVILPLLRPAVAASWLLSFTLSLDDVIISSFVTGPGYEILPIKVFSMVKVGVSPEVNVLASLLMLISLLVVIVVPLLLKRKTQ